MHSATLQLLLQLTPASVDTLLNNPATGVVLLWYSKKEVGKCAKCCQRYAHKLPAQPSFSFRQRFRVGANGVVAMASTRGTNQQAATTQMPFLFRSPQESDSGLNNQMVGRSLIAAINIKDSVSNINKGQLNE